MTKSKTSKKIKQPKGLEPDMKGSLGHSVGITPLLPPSRKKRSRTPVKRVKEIDPVQQLDEALRICKNNTEQKKETIKTLDAISKEQKDKVIEPLLMARREELEGTKKKAKVVSSNGEIIAFFQEKTEYEYTSEEYIKITKEIKLKENELEAIQKNEIVNGTAILKSHRLTVTVR